MINLMRMTDKSYSKRLALMWLCATIMQIGMVKASDLDSSRFIRLKEFDGYLHTTYNLTSLIPVKSRIECASLCMQNQECGSFFYLDTPQRLCQTHSVLFLTTNESTPTAGATYYQLTQGEYVELMFSSLLVLLHDVPSMLYLV